MKYFTFILFLSLHMMWNNRCSSQSLTLKGGLNVSDFSDFALFDFTYAGRKDELIQIEASLKYQGKLIWLQSASASNASGMIYGNSILVQNENRFAGFLQNELLMQGLIPEGIYELCVSIKSSEGVSNDCQSFNHVAKMSRLAIQLIYPIDNTILPTQFPNLFWTSMVPFQTPGVSYVVELFENFPEARQKDFSALATKRIFKSENIQDQALLYPTDARQLEFGKKYNWQVHLFIDGQIVARSEIWSFQLEDPLKLSDLPITSSFIDVSRITGEPTYYFMESLKLKLSPKGSNESYRLVILKENGEQVKLKHDQLTFSRSNPYILYDLTEIESVIHLKKYNCQLISDGGNTVSFNLVYVNPLLLGN